MTEQEAPSMAYILMSIGFAMNAFGVCLWIVGAIINSVSVGLQGWLGK